MGSGWEAAGGGGVGGVGGLGIKKHAHTHTSLWGEKRGEKQQNVIAAEALLTYSFSGC